jgi:glycosyltransferase involved in cell wall biosynthesis
MNSTPDAPVPDLVCLSHLRWNFVFQRPQHLMTRFARERRVFFVEEPIFEERASRLVVTPHRDGVIVAVPHLRKGLSPDEVLAAQRGLLDRLLAEHEVHDPVLWYYSPMALPFSRHVRARAVVYDCMDELTGFAGAPPELGLLERELLARADLVTTGGRSLYEAKRPLHRNVHPFPSSVDSAHFARARVTQPDPADQARIDHPRLGYFGVIDERMDLPLVSGVAEARPGWQVILLGPIVKIDPASIPRLPNLHLLGAKQYAELPAYLAGWDVGLMPFARNDATRFISPTKTPEFLAAGLPVISTSIRDVVNPYGDSGLVEISDTVEGVVSAAERFLLEDGTTKLHRRAEATAFLSEMSWDRTWSAMKTLVDQAVRARHEVEVATISSPQL